MCLKRPEIPGMLAARFPGVYQFLLHKGYIDELYDGAIVQPIKALSENVLWKADVKVIDGAVNGSGFGAEGLGGAFRRLQTGRVQQYGSLLFGATALLALALVAFV